MATKRNTQAPEQASPDEALKPPAEEQVDKLNDNGVVDELRAQNKELMSMLKELQSRGPNNPLVEGTRSPEAPLTPEEERLYRQQSEGSLPQTVTVQLNLEVRVFEWLIAKAQREAYIRRCDPDEWNVERHMVFMLREAYALDPERHISAKSGPAKFFNKAAGRYEV